MTRRIVVICLAIGSMLFVAAPSPAALCAGPPDENEFCVGEGPPCCIPPRPPDIPHDIGTP